MYTFKNIDSNVMYIFYPLISNLAYIINKASLIVAEKITLPPLLLS